MLKTTIQDKKTKKEVGKNIKKTDSMAILLGEKSYTEDFIDTKDLLYIKIVRSPYAFAKIITIDTTRAKKIPGIFDIYTYKDTPKIRYTECGESYPEASPHDRLILDQILRYVGDEVAIVAADSIEAAENAARLVKVTYDVFKPILTIGEAKKAEQIIHPEDDVFVPFDFGYDSKKNRVSKFLLADGDIDAAMKNSEVIIEQEYKTQAQAHAMMETLRAYARIDHTGRLIIISANQSVNHMRRQVAHALGLSINKVCLKRYRIGGGFGGKNVAITEPIVGFVTWKTKRPSVIIYDRTENFTSTSTRHEMSFKVKIGAMKDGTIKGIDMYCYNNTGAYGSNGPAVTMEAGQNTLPIYAKAEAIRFTGETYYTNMVSAGALRGYGTPQGSFALGSAMNELAHKLKIDPVELRYKNTIRAGFTGGIVKSKINSINVEECLEKGKQMISWDEKYPRKQINPHLIRGVGMDNVTHSCGVSNIDVANITLRLEEDGSYTMFTNSADLGTGSDSILLSIAADALHTTSSNVVVVSGDTDTCPYDTGAYASCTTYLTGNAIMRAAKTLKIKLIETAAAQLECESRELVLKNDRIEMIGDPDNYITLKQIGINSAVGPDAQSISSTETFGIKNTPRPYLAGFAEVEVDTRTMDFKVIKYVAAIDCGTVVAPNLARVQAEGGIAQGIGYATLEEVRYSSDGELRTDSFLKYKIPTRNDFGEIDIEFCPSYEDSGPFGAKSLGEIVINSPAQAIADAVFNAIGVRIRDLPVTREKLLYALKEREDQHG